MKALQRSSETRNARYKLLRPKSLPRKAQAARQDNHAAIASQTMTPAKSALLTTSGVPYRDVVSLTSFKLPEAKGQESPRIPSALPASARLLRNTTLNQTAQKNNKIRFRRIT